MQFTWENIKIYYETIGKKEPVIVLHGWGANHKSFNKLASLLQSKYQVYLIDLPGFGKSEEPFRPYNLNDYVRFLKAFIEMNKLENPILIGHSFGGRIAIRYSINNPVNKLILISSAGIKRFSFKTKCKILGYKLRKSYYKLTKQLFLLEKLTRSSGSSDYQASSSIMKQTMNKIIKENQRKELSKIKCETLLIWGKNDKTTPYKDGKVMRQKIKNSGLVTFKNSGHFPYIDEEYTFNQVIKFYLQVSDYQ